MIAALEGQRTFFHAGNTRPLAKRREGLERLRNAIEACHPEVLDALRADLGKSAHEAYASEVAYVLGDIRHALRHLASWAKPRRRRSSLALWPARSVVMAEPFGVSLILGPWNYPFQLLLSPLVSAVAAGNCALLKPSEHAPHTAQVIGRIIADVFPVEWVSVVQGDHQVAKDLLRERFDKIFFTGGSTVGREVMQAAARHLTPVTLELGGKCPCIVTADTDLKVAAKRIVWGKFMNAGQTCVAPDHLWVERGALAALSAALKQAIREFYGEDPRRSEDYGRIVNRGHFDRLLDLLQGAQVASGGDHDRDELYLGPTLVTPLASDSPLMQEEIFGPILPLLEYEDLDALLEGLQGKAAPLALYLFSDDRAVQRKVVERTRSGGVCINDTISHLLNRHLPFGGLGESGLGACHGKAGFEAFSHQRAVMTRGIRPDFGQRYPPMGLTLEKLRRILRLFGEG